MHFWKTILRFLPLLVFAAGIGLTCVTWDMVRQQDRQHLQTFLKTRTSQFRDGTLYRIESQIKALRRMANRWEFGGQPQKDIWEQEVDDYMADFQNFQAIEWVNPEFRIKWVHPLRGNEQAMNLDLAFEPKRKAALEYARDNGIISVSRTVNLVQGGKGFLVYIPLFIDQKFMGFLTGVFRIKEFLDHHIRDRLPGDIAFAAFDGSDKIYETGSRAALAGEAWKVEAELKFFRNTWRFHLWPTQDWVKDNESWLPGFLIVIGCSTSFLIGLVVHLAQKSRGRARELSHINLRLNQEIQERQILEEKARTSERRFRSMAELSPSGLFELDRNDLLQFVNPTWERITGIHERQALGASWHHIIHQEDIGRVVSEWSRARISEKDFESDFRIKNREGKMIWVKFRARPLGDVVFGTLSDITQDKQEAFEKETQLDELVKLKNNLETTARTDPLTSLPNRRYMKELLNGAQAGADRQKRPFSLLISDIDHFKKINDTYGHNMGDLALIEVAKSLQANCRANDTVARWGGEEFLILLPETGQEGARFAAEKMRTEVQNLSFKFGETSFRITMSFGVATYLPGGSIENCIHQADVCLYAAKDAGRNQVAVAPLRATPQNIINLKSKKHS